MLTTILRCHTGDRVKAANYKTALGLDLQNILRQSYDYHTIMSKLRSTYDGRLVYNILRRA